MITDFILYIIQVNLTMSSNTVSHYLFRCKDYYPNDALRIVHKACYGGNLKDVRIMFRWLKNDNKTRNIYDKIMRKITETHEKINEYIDNFNKDTNYKYEEEFKKENRKKYCNDKNCHYCIDISCLSINHCCNIDLESEENNYENKDINFYPIENEIPDIIKKMIDEKI